MLKWVNSKLLLKKKKKGQNKLILILQNKSDLFIKESYNVYFLTLKEKNQIRSDDHFS